MGNFMLAQQNGPMMVGIGLDTKPHSILARVRTFQALLHQGYQRCEKGSNEWINIEAIPRFLIQERSYHRV
jgi:hypothetical protein